MSDYICNDCGAKFNELDMKVKQDRLYIDGRLSNIDYICSCPYCGSDDIEEDDDE